MAQIEMIMPKMGESVAEATILKWLKNVGDKIEADESILEIATDKVDSDVPAPAAGTLSKRLFAEGDVVQVGAVIAVIETDASVSVQKSNGSPAPEVAKQVVNTPAPSAKKEIEKTVEAAKTTVSSAPVPMNSGNRFYSPLVKNIATQEGITVEELDRINGTGNEGRVTKNDVMNYLQNRTKQVETIAKPVEMKVAEPVKNEKTAEVPISKPAPSVNGEYEIVEMDRMRKLIAEHMVMSKRTSAHVTSYVEIDVTNMVMWRNRIKDDFEKREKQKITFTPIFIEAVARAIRDFPMVNVSVDGTSIIVKKNINIGMATALPSGNLIVPVIKKADDLNLLGLTKAVNDLANRALNNKLSPDDIAGGTFTVTNVGTFGNSMGTPIINQPQVAILATGAIKKKPAVIETPEGDTIGIRHMMFLSLSYDHRVVDGALGGSFLRKVADYLEQFDAKRTI